MNRRKFITGASGISVAALLGTSVAWQRSGKIREHRALADGAWRNWSGNQMASPKALAQPENNDELKLILKNTQGTIRPVGAGHSFTQLVPTDGTILNLDKMSGIISVDHSKKTAWVQAGTRLRDLSPVLEKRNLAFKNLGDIDVQSVAGAIGTATHGTGKLLPCLSAEVIGLKFMTANGDQIAANAHQNTNILRAGQVSMGALGIITEAEVSLRDNFKLHRKTWVEPFKTTLSKAEQYWEENRNFEFFYIPHSDHTYCITHNMTDADISPRAEQEDDKSTMRLKQVRDFTKWNPNLRRKLIANAVAEEQGEDVVGISWQLLASQRNIRMNEMEYHLPVDQALGTLQEIIHTIEAKRPDVFIPIEVRRTAADTAWLSPFQGGGRISIAIHAYFKDDYQWLFTHIEPMLRRARGRPHWGKLHSLTSNELRDMYPDFNKFTSLRRELDPTGKFLNPYLSKLLGEQSNG